MKNLEPAFSMAVRLNSTDGTEVQRYSKSKPELDKHRYSKSLIIFFRICYYICYTPFRIEVDPNTHQLIIHKNPFQIILCGVSTILHLCYIQHYARSNWKDSEIKEGGTNARVYFQALDAITYVIHMITITFAVWRNSTKIVDLLKHLDKFNKELRKKSKWNFFTQEEVGVSISSIALIGLSFAVVLAPEGLGQIDETFGVSGSWFHDSLKEARKMVFLEQRSIGHTDDTSGFDWFLLVIFIAVQIVGNLKDLFGELYLIFGLLPLWKAVIDFNGRIQKLNLQNRVYLQDWTSIYKDFRMLKRAFSLLNDIYGLSILSYSTNAMVFYSTKLDGVFRAESIVPRILTGTFIVTASALYIIAADMVSKMEFILTLMSRKELVEKIPKRQLLIVTEEVRRFYVVTVKGSVLFSITYELLGNMIKIIMTHFLICISPDITQTRTVQ